MKWSQTTEEDHPTGLPSGPACFESWRLSSLPSCPVFLLPVACSRGGRASARGKKLLLDLPCCSLNASKAGLRPALSRHRVTTLVAQTEHASALTSGF